MKKIYLMALGTLLLMTSCLNDFLDVEPESSIPQNKFWKTEDDLKYALNGAYSQLQSVYNDNGGMSNLAWFVVRGDNFIGGNAGSRAPMLDVSFNVIPSGHVTTNWNVWYKVIGSVNYALHYIPQVTTVTESVKNKYVSEAAFLRAYCYFNLARIWGAVPLVLEPTLVPSDAGKPFRSKHKKVIEQVYKDLDLALEKSDKKTSDLEINRANLAAIYALYVQVCMWQCEEEGVTADYVKAVKMADELYKMKFSLHPRDSYNKIFAEGNTSENIWTLEWSWASNSTNNANYEMCKGFDVSLGMAKKFRELWETPDYIDDKRKFFCIDTDYNIPTRYPNDYVTVKMYKTAMRKWVEGNGKSDFMGTNNETPITLLRLSDIILLKAEAYNKLEKYDEALAELKKVRDVAGLPERKLEEYSTDPAKRMDEIENDILDERRFELMGETNCRIFDLMRTGKLKEVMNDYFKNEILVSAPSVTVNLFSNNVWFLPVYESNIIENENLLADPIE